MAFSRSVRGAVLLLAMLACGVCPPPTFAQQVDYSKVAVRSQQLAKNVYVLFGAGGNVGLLTGPDGAVIIDDQFAAMAPKLRSAVALLTDQPVRFVINTHWHPDHSGSNEAFGRAGSIIVAHENTRVRLSAPQVVDLFKMQTTALPSQALPVVTFSDSIDLHLNGEDIAVVHVANAHTDSDAVLFFKQANVVHTGDVFTTGGYPFIDTGTGGSIDGLIAASAQILARIDAQTQVIPGHGPIATRADIETRQQMLVTVRERIAAQLRKHRSLQQVIDSKPTKEFDALYFKGGALSPDLWVQRVYLDLARTVGKPPAARPPANKPAGTG